MTTTTFLSNRISQFVTLVITSSHIHFITETDSWKIVRDHCIHFNEDGIERCKDMFEDPRFDHWWETELSEEAVARNKKKEWADNAVNVIEHTSQEEFNEFAKEYEHEQKQSSENEESTYHACFSNEFMDACNRASSLNWNMIKVHQRLSEEFIKECDKRKNNIKNNF